MTEKPPPNYTRDRLAAIVARDVAVGPDWQTPTSQAEADRRDLLSLLRGLAYVSDPTRFPWISALSPIPTNREAQEDKS